MVLRTQNSIYDEHKLTTILSNPIYASNFENIRGITWYRCTHPTCQRYSVATTRGRGASITEFKLGA